MAAFVSPFMEKFRSTHSFGDTTNRTRRTAKNRRQRDRRGSFSDQCRPARRSQVRMANMANTEPMAVTLQKICNGFPLFIETRRRSVYPGARQIGVTS
jgi:hypothetical protein